VVGALPLALYDKFVETMRRLGKTDDIRSVGSLVYRMVEITTEYLNAKEAELAADICRAATSHQVDDDVAMFKTVSNMNAIRRRSPRRRASVIAT
jgi:hypothetical protein